MSARGWSSVRAIGVVAGLLLGSTAIVAALETWTGVPNAAVVYLVAVVACGLVVGTAGAVAAAIGSVVVYTYFFTEPLHTFTIDDPELVLTLVLLLFTGIVVGRLAASQRDRTATAEAREREARALFGVSRVLATRESTADALEAIAAAVGASTGMRRVWIALGSDQATERIAADSGAGPVPATGRTRVLQRRPGDEPATWATVVAPGTPRRAGTEGEVYRARIEASGEVLGSIWGERDRTAGAPDAMATRLLATTADQVGQALARDRAAAAARSAEVAQRSDRLKSSLLQSVSHDFRTPLAVIRAAAGTLAEPSDLSADDRRANAAAIDREVEYLDRLVANLLDLSRIEAGALRARPEVYAIDDLLDQPVERARGRLDGRSLEVDLVPTPVRVDPVFLAASVTNILDNALAHTPGDARIRVRAAAAGTDVPGVVRVTIEDDGPGVPEEMLPRLFERFYQGGRSPGTHRAGLGIGLAVAQGLTQVMGGQVRARRSVLGGLAIDLDVPAAEGVP